MRYSKIYSQSNCVSECSFSKAALKCGCTPWNFPQHENDTVCDFGGASCFEKELADSQTCESDVKCWEPCQKTSFSPSELVNAIDAEKECKDLLAKTNDSIHFPISHPILYYQEFEPMDLRHFSIANNFKKDSLKCILAMRKTSILHIKPAVDRVNVITQRRRITFSDQLSSFGRKKNFNFSLSCCIQAD